jgi:hypothetical protein
VVQVRQIEALEQVLQPLGQGEQVASFSQKKGLHWQRGRSDLSS